MFHQKSSDYKETIVQYNLGFSSKMGVLNEKRCKKQFTQLLLQHLDKLKKESELKLKDSEKLELKI